MSLFPSNNFSHHFTAFSALLLLLFLESGACDFSPCLPTQDCIVNPAGGHWCLCPPGQEISLDGTACEPLRRTCDMWGVCSQNCITSVDEKVKCFCQQNYTIEPDLYTCRHDGN